MLELTHWKNGSKVYIAFDKIFSVVEADFKAFEGANARVSSGGGDFIIVKETVEEIITAFRAKGVVKVRLHV